MSFAEQMSSGSDQIQVFWKSGKEASWRKLETELKTQEAGTSLPVVWILHRWDSKHVWEASSSKFHLWRLCVTIFS